jgi:hypothetical protein
VPLKEFIIMFDSSSALTDLIQKQIIGENAIFLPFSEGTTSIVGKIGSKDSESYVLKINEPSVLEMEVNYLQTYTDNLLFPKLVYVDSKHRYIVYKFVEGHTLRKDPNKLRTLSFLSSMIVGASTSVEGNASWGWLDDLSDSWYEFMIKRVDEAVSVLGEQIDQEMIADIVKRYKSNAVSSPCLLHGDFGYHNFLFHSGKLKAVIDPTPIFGPPLYDLVYAFCSTPYDLTISTIQEPAFYLGNWKPESKLALIEEVLVGLFCRISTCRKRHVEDFPDYMTAWEYWVQLYDNERGKKFF